MPSRRHLSTLVGISAASVVLVLAGCTAPDASQTGADATPAPTWSEPAPPPAAASAPDGPGIAGGVDAAWLAATAESTGIPSRALAAYAGAAIEKAAQMPTCGLAWNTLAAIGFAESRHGTHGGSEIAADGTATPAILGIALDGASTDRIADTDGGVIDGDPEYDRAVGPMQFIPQTWRNWHVDANHDGVEDPQNIDDATTASANYLCRASGDMADETGWRAGIAAYNSDPDYAVVIAEAGSRYRVLAG
jgi:membrane-bound lytic murein transglycosylase B